ncbi:UNKNOWN [Stylonychia lemnae]|uniref:WD40-repeat-containing domain n=1 Tax=Stylonychia lemnae TaxID=5949 RepID=A0A077ZWD7_STYLE|nr:UNKNOWN [Stylonychia lemnae]|eukprot:CDW73901.1 UNKNOWN [Stylonychia lemnae]
MSRSQQHIDQEIINFVKISVLNLKQLIGSWEMSAKIFQQLISLSGHQDQGILDYLENRKDAEKVIHFNSSNNQYSKFESQDEESYYSSELQMIVQKENSINQSIQFDMSQVTHERKKMPLTLRNNIVDIQILGLKKNIQMLSQLNNVSINNKQIIIQQRNNQLILKEKESQDKQIDQSQQISNKNSNQEQAFNGQKNKLQKGEEIKQKNIDSNQDSNKKIGNDGKNKNLNPQDNQNQFTTKGQGWENQQSKNILLQDPQFKHLKKVSKDEQDKFNNLKLVKEINLSSDKKTTTLFYNNIDEKLLLGLNDAQTQLFSIKQNQEWVLTHPNTPISIFNYKESIYCGQLSSQVTVLDQSTYQQKTVIMTKEVVIKIISFIQFDNQSQISQEYLAFLEEKGFIEFYCPQEDSIIFSYQHSCQMDIKDGFQVQNSNQICLAFAQLQNNVYSRGQLSFIEVIKSQNTHQQSSNNYDNSVKVTQEIKIEELENIDYFNNKSVFCIQQISTNCFIACCINSSFFFFNRERPQDVQQIFNPSSSINYNSLIKIEGFGENLPYLFFRDSRSLGVINCKTLEAFTLAKGIDYARCGNLYSLEQSRDKEDGKINLYTMTYDRKLNKRQLLIYALDIS